MRLKVQLSLDSLNPVRPLKIIGAVNAMAAHIAEQAGFDGLWLSGLELSSALGLPDTNVLTVRDFSDAVLALRRTTSIPIIVDIDNAGGSVENAARYAQDLLAAGASAVCLEDSSYPKCNSFSLHRSQQIATLGLLTEQIWQIKKTAPELQVIGRTESLIAGHDIPYAVARGREFKSAGADAVLIHSKDSSGSQAAQVAAAWEKHSPLVTVPTAFPQLTAAELGSLGFNICIYANQLTRASFAAMKRLTEEFQKDDTFNSSGVVPLAQVSELLAIGDPGARACV